MSTGCGRLKQALFEYIEVNKLKHRRLTHILIVVMVVAAIGIGHSAGAYTAADWLMYRGQPNRPGLNGDTNGPGQANLRWVWPPSAQIPADVVVDNLDLPAPTLTFPWTTTEAQFGVSGANWVDPVTTDRAPGAYPYDQTNADYVYAPAVYNQDLANIGTSVLSQLPDVGNLTTSAIDPNIYARVWNDLNLSAQTDGYAQWVMGPTYPTGTSQGTVDVSGQNIPTGRYAAYINFPGSGTLINGVAHPNVNDAFVKVSWGANPNDPTTSRIFMINMGQTGGNWVRIQTSTSDDRYFPYDGTHPLVVTLYLCTPDNVSDSTQFGAAPIIPADAVRFVPEAFRGDIEDSPVSAVFDTPRSPNGEQLTFFGRNESVPDPSASVPTDPTQPVSSTNPLVLDPTQSITAAVFYCLDNGGNVVWRYVAQTSGLQNVIVDNTDPNFTNNGFTVETGDQSFGGTYTATPAVNNQPAASATWEASLPPTTNSTTNPGGYYSIWAWIPAESTTIQHAQQAQYTIDSDLGTFTVTVDQRLFNSTGASTGGFKLIASGVHFGPGTLNGQSVSALGEVSVSAYSPTDTTAGRYVVADAIEFVPETGLADGVVASPTLTSVTYPNGTTVPMVIFATTGGRVYALDPIGVWSGTNPIGITSAYWAYPSLSNAGDENANNPLETITDPTLDPNNTQGFDGNVVPGPPTSTGQATKEVVYQTPTLGAFNSSPVVTQVTQGNVTTPMVVLGNSNGRVYALDLEGRMRNNFIDYQPATVAGSPGIPGTTYRLITWPSTGHDLACQSGVLPTPNLTQDITPAPNITIPADNPAKTGFYSSPSILTDANGNAVNSVIGAEDGHVYAVDIRDLTHNRISNYGNVDANGYTLPDWVYPDPAKDLESILSTPAIYPNNGNPIVVFTAGGRVIAINDPNTQNGSDATLQWDYPYAADPTVTNLASGDQSPLAFQFTANSPAIVPNVTINGTADTVVYVANTDGTIYALNLNSPLSAAIAPLWVSRSLGPTRSSVIWVNNLIPQTTFGGNTDPAIALGYDTGAVAAFDATNGNEMWWYPDSSFPRPNSIADANGWLYCGDSGGQMRAYSGSGGVITPGEPNINTNQGNIDLRGMDVYGITPWETFGQANGQTPNSASSTNVAAPSQSTVDNVVVFEWGDTIYAAAWGAYMGNAGTIQAQFNVISGASTTSSTMTSNQQGNAKVYAPDPNYTGPQLTIDGQNANPWVATYSYRIGRGSAKNPQTPGTEYTVSVMVWMRDPTTGTRYMTPVLMAGQRYNPSLAGQAGQQSNSSPARQMALANPLAITTRGVPLSGTTYGNTVYNIMGYTTADSVANAAAEVLGNGERIVDPSTLATTGYKDIAAPLGFIVDGSSSVFTGVDANGNPIQSFYLADRSHLYLIGQVLSNVRVQSRDLAWQGGAGAVMNALPWDQAPTMVPNVSLDYPNNDQRDIDFNVNGQNMAVQPVSLTAPTVSTTGLLLQPTAVQLQVSIPPHQPANVNRAYADISGVVNPTNWPDGLLAPMVTSTGQDPLSSGLTNLDRLISASAGYVGGYLIYVDSANNGRFIGPQGNLGNGNTVPGGVEDAFRALQVGAAVPPDLKLGILEKTIDEGNVPQGTGFNPNFAFSPTGVGPYLTTPSPWENVNAFGNLFLPITVQNNGNINLVNLRVARVASFPPNLTPNMTSPIGYFGTLALGGYRMSSDEVSSIFNFELAYDLANNINPLTDPILLQRTSETIFAQPWQINVGGTGSIGVVSSLDHDPASFLFGDNLWTSGVPNPYWTGGAQPQPTLHKPRPNDSLPTVMSIPDKPYAGDPQGLFAQAGITPHRPRIGVAIPIGTPVGTYSVPLYVFEDEYPPQWRDWLNFYYQQTGGTNPLSGTVDNDGLLNGTLTSGGFNPLEAVSNPSFRLKVNVREARLTNGMTQGDLAQIDLPPAPGTAPFLDSNLQPAAIRDLNANNGSLYVYWASNRQPNIATPPTPDSPWQIFNSTLHASETTVNGTPLFDWQYAAIGANAQWWTPAAALFANAPINNLFPSLTIDIVGTAPLPLVPGTPNPLTEKMGSPAVTQDDVTGQQWLFWQGQVQKTNTSGTVTLDNRTFYVPLTNGQPPANTQVPYSFLNDPALYKYDPKPLALTTLGGSHFLYLFWYGGAHGRTAIYYNVNSTNPTNPSAWSQNFQLTLPTAFSWVSDPVAIHRIVSAVINGTQTSVDAIDVVYTGVLKYRGTSEQFLTRFLVNPNNGILTPTALMDIHPVLPPFDNGIPGGVQNQPLTRNGTTNTWTAPDIAWYAYNATQNGIPGTGYVDANGNPWVAIMVNGTQVNEVGPGHPVRFDAATGDLYYDSTLGGQLVVDPQVGTVTFPNTAPGPSDAVTASYIPQTMRLNVTHNGSSFMIAVNGFAFGANDPGLQKLPSVPVAGATRAACAFLDRSPNPRLRYIIPTPTSLATSPEIDRLWLFYRKIGANGAASIFYKTMRLMIRLPRSIVFEPNSQVPAVQVVGNRGPVEVDVARGRLYFTQVDEGNVVEVNFGYGVDSNGNPIMSGPAYYRVGWGDEMSATGPNSAGGGLPIDQTIPEAALPNTANVNEGQVCAFKDPFQDRVWVFWASTRAGTSDLYYEAISPQFYPQGE